MIGLDVEARPLAADDTDRLIRMFDRLSRDTVQRRFFTVFPRLEGPALRALTDVDHDASEALVVQIGDELVAIASYHRRADDGSVAEVAVLVEDGWQHHGVGRQLMKALTRVAAERGITSFHADVLGDNRPAVGMVHRMNPGTKGRLESGTLAFDLPLAAA